MTNPLKSIRTLGQSVWYDNLGRELLRSGELQRMMDEDAVTGVTSNPTIFEKAISSERTYDSDLHTLVDKGLDVHEIYEELVTADIQDAADLLGPVYDASSGTDGYVSLEVSPHAAYDAAATIEQGERLFRTVGRKNVMIKVPATDEGFVAITELLGRGVNVNATLIFSLDQYRATAEAYMAGLEKWISTGGDPRAVAGVASFFVSRVDTAVDELLREMADPRVKPVARSLLGKAAIANAKMAYSIYQQLFLGARFSSLRDKGARPQRIVWASTSTKDPDYPVTYYVDALIGPDTINTMPRVTLEAYRSVGRPAARLHEGLEAAEEVFPKLAQLGVDMGEVMDTLLEDGVRLFADSYDQLFKGVAEKRTRLLRGWGHRSASLGELHKAVDERLKLFDQAKMGHSVWSGDVTIWGEDPDRQAAIAKRLGWLTVSEDMTGETHKLRAFADEVRNEGYKHAVLLGMGGSSLASEVFIRCFGAAEGFLDLKVLDTTVPGSILDAEREVDLAKTLFIVASKSGGTIEVVSLFEYFWAKAQSLFGSDAGRHFIAITDPGTGLGKLAAEKGFRKTFLNPPDIGGRFSALSYFGLTPAALIGIDLDRLLMRASQAVEAAAEDVPALENQGLWLGTCLAQASLAGKDKLSLIISPGVAIFGCWLEQLVAESTGKEGKGIAPIDGEPLGDPEVYGTDRLFVYLRMDNEGGYDEQVSALERFGHPVITLRLHTPFDLGREVFRWELATAVAGAILGINPFDEPNVTESKDITKRLLEEFKRERSLPAGDKLSAKDPDLASALKAFLAMISVGDYVAFNVFMRPTDDTMETLRSVRTLIRDRFRVATTVGFGPRYLHSTGQIHKGGPDKGLFIQITCDDAEDADIPSAPYSFGILKSAQAQGDYEALKTKGRRIIRIHCDNESDMANILEATRSAVITHG